MSIGTVVNDVKGRVEGLACQSQKALKYSIDSFRHSGEIVRDGLQSLIEGHTSAAKEIFTSAKSGFEKARTDGLKAVVSSPVDYLPPRDSFVGLFTDTATVFSKTGDQLLQTAKHGFANVKAELRGETPVVHKVKASVHKSGTGARKTARKTARRTARKTAAAAK
ncbi:MAG: hypothetical protein KGJ55_02035 [Gammaproteobacteria bacterium]|nr:hypothetical protein [Gammaproteobacteria bacterium]